MDRSRKDPNQIVQCEHDDVTGAKKVTILDTDFSMELDADDGDSVQTQARCMSIQAIDGQIIDISKYSRVKMYIESSGANTTPVELEISPEEAGNFFMSSGMTMTPGANIGDSNASNELSIMAMRARIPNTNGHKVILVFKGV